MQLLYATAALIIFVCVVVVVMRKVFGSNKTRIDDDPIAQAIIRSEK